ncbi:hypothetical protein B0A49_01328 [Cryomyces minteri]|uniref:Flavoprotein domain-containing protein n=2 Tax=Cryomyces minteri TaxID=331657 RepID=A0A4U0XRR9_9PEZI|nr:hypothetical protein B0A49_01328 [Cryomyces minteri]
MPAPTVPPLPQHPSKKSAPLVAADHIRDGKVHLLLAASGSVATIKLPSIVHALSNYPNLSIRLILTHSASNFLAGQSSEQPALHDLENVPNVDGIYHDEDEWSKPWTRGGAILHIELRRWADLLVVAPLSANSLAKIASGLCDNLLLSTIRAWDTTGDMDVDPERLAQRGGRKKIIVVAPAMNTAMWKHPITKKQVGLLEGEWNVKNGGWFEVLRPVEKALACGDTGDGAMREWREIVGVIESKLGLGESNKA